MVFREVSTSEANWLSTTTPRGKSSHRYTYSSGTAQSSPYCISTFSPPVFPPSKKKVFLVCGTQSDRPWHEFAYDSRLGFFDSCPTARRDDWTIYSRNDKEEGGQCPQDFWAIVRGTKKAPAGVRSLVAESGGVFPAALIPGRGDSRLKKRVQNWKTCTASEFPVRHCAELHLLPAMTAGGHRTRVPGISNSTEVLRNLITQAKTRGDRRSEMFNRSMI